ncbi:hypothetical protein NLJ89_g306 [Agrocybe chaxingu]|uniref:Tropomyosin n=1 Tax=Agrocybe chaxingu TaxID=84603 RepID=A0A9W8N247_9AGAR|nr:hypothetical protein NLJ89_g306 [Agrocybe chaxingu]
MREKGNEYGGYSRVQEDCIRKDEQGDGRSAKASYVQERMTDSIDHHRSAALLTVAQSNLGRVLLETRRAQLATASKRAAEAERIAQINEAKLKEKTAEVERLQQRLYLAQQRCQLTKELLVVLPKLDEAKMKLAALTETADRCDAKLQSLQSESDVFEAKFQRTKKEYDDLVREMEGLGL